SGDALITGDATITGNDITMGTNTAGYILLSDGANFSPDGLTGDGTISATGTFTITANAVALGTDTTGDFVARIVGGDGVSSTAASSGEATQHTLAVDLLSVAVNGGTSTGSVSGMEFINGELTLVTGCANGDILKGNEATDSWFCDAD